MPIIQIFCISPGIFAPTMGKKFSARLRRDCIKIKIYFMSSLYFLYQNCSNWNKIDKVYKEKNSKLRKEKVKKLKFLFLKIDKIVN